MITDLYRFAVLLMVFWNEKTRFHLMLFKCCPTSLLLLCRNIWVASSEKVPSNIRRMRKFRSSYSCAMYHPGLCSLLIHSIVSNDSVSGRWRPRSDCASAQSDLGLRRPHMPKDTFPPGTTQTMCWLPCFCCVSNLFIGHLDTFTSSGVFYHISSDRSISNSRVSG